MSGENLNQAILDEVKGLKTDLPALVKTQVDVAIQDENLPLSVAIKDLADQQKALDTWLKEVEERVNKARHGSGVGGAVELDALKTAIPARHLKALELWSRTPKSHDEVVKTVAMESWLKNLVLLHNPAMGRIHAKLFEEMDALEKAMGFEPTNKALQEGTDSEGGYTVPVPLEATVLRLAANTAIMRRLCRVMPMAVVTHNIPDLASNLSVAIVDEEGTIGTSDPAFGQKALTAKKIAVRAITSLELVQDSAIGILDFLVTLMTEQYGLFEDAQVLEGDGTGSNFTGVVAASSVLEVTNGTNGATWNPAKATEQKWKARSRAARRGCAWVVAPEIVQQMEAFRETVLVAGDALGGFLYTPNQNRGGIDGTSDGPAGTLHGYPIYDHDQTDVARTVGSATNCTNMYFGPWGNATVIGDLLGLTFGVSEHTQWATGQLDLRMMKRTGVLVTVPEAMTKQTGIKIA